MDVKGLDSIQYYTITSSDPSTPDPREARIPIVNPKHSQSLIKWLFNSYGTLSCKRFELIGKDANNPEILLVNYTDDPVVNTKQSQLLAIVLKVLLVFTVIVPVIALIVYFIHVKNAKKYQFAVNPKISSGPSQLETPPPLAPAAPPISPPPPEPPKVNAKSTVALPPQQPVSKPSSETTRASTTPSSKVNTNIFMPKIVDFILINKVTAYDMETKETKQIEVSPVYMGKNIWGYDCFYLIPKDVADAVKAVEKNLPLEEAQSAQEEYANLSLGVIQIQKIEDAIFIREMNSYRTKFSNTYKNIGNALHEFAIRYSFSQKFDGRVRLESARGTDGFHYKFGYRYQKQHWMSDVQCCNTKHNKDTAQLCDMCEQYFLKRKAGSDDCELAEKIAHHAYFDVIKQTAAKELKREPQDIFEAINYGLWIFWDLHKVYDKFYFHPEENIASRVCNPIDRKFKNDNPMFLPDEERQKWKQIIEG